ncbi:hypothetical protein D9M70_559010 [compost metagenome]
MVPPLAPAGRYAQAPGRPPRAFAGAPARLPVVRQPRRDTRGGGARPARRAAGNRDQPAAALRQRPDDDRPERPAIPAMARRAAGRAVRRQPATDPAQRLGADHLRAARRSGRLHAEHGALPAATVRALPAAVAGALPDGDRCGAAPARPAQRPAELSGSPGGTERARLGATHPLPAEPGPAGDGRG